MLFSLSGLGASTPESNHQNENLLIMDFLIRWIQPEDNGSIKNLVVKVLLEHGAQGEGFASSDPELDCMFETYQNA